MSTYKKIADNLSFQLKDISTFRSELMGWSIIWIMMLHFRFIIIKPFGFVAQYGFAGVEIFMFVSGLGLYYSLAKTPDLLPFYKKRLIRIFPVYYFVGIFASLLLFHDTLFCYIYRYTTIGFWTGNCFFEWYIPTIVAFYLAAPFIKRLMCSRARWVFFLVIVIVLITSYFAAREQYLDRNYFFGFYRLPSFMLGMYCGMLIKQGSPTRPYWIALVAGLPVFAYCFPLHHAVYEFKYYSLLFLLPTFIYVFCTLSKLMGRARCVIRSIGNASLEVYLIQTLFFTAIINNMLPVPAQWHDAITLLLMVLCSLAGIGLHHVVGRIKILNP